MLTFSGYLGRQVVLPLPVAKQLPSPLPPQRTVPLLRVCFPPCVRELSLKQLRQNTTPAYGLFLSIMPSPLLPSYSKYRLYILCVNENLYISQEAVNTKRWIKPPYRKGWRQFWPPRTPPPPLLPSALRRFMSEEKGDESQPPSELAHTWARLKERNAFGSGSFPEDKPLIVCVCSFHCCYLKHYKLFILFFEERKKGHFFRDTSMKMVMPGEKTIPTKQSLWDWPPSSTCFVTACFTLIFHAPPLLSFLSFLSESWFLLFRLRETVRVAGLKDFKCNGIISVVGQVNCEWVCVSSQGHPSGLRYLPSVSHHKEEILPCNGSLFPFF